VKSRVLSKTAINKLFRQLNQELQKDSVQGEVYLVGGAVMCLVYQARASTHDIDAFFKPSGVLRAAANKVALKNGISGNWLNDGVKSFLSEHGNFKPYMELSHLKVFTAEPAYLLAMKCLSARIGEEFHDIEDIRYLLRYLNVTESGQAKTIIARYYPLEKFPQKTLYLLEELLPED
jgi:hypothetical protein